MPAVHFRSQRFRRRSDGRVIAGVASGSKKGWRMTAAIVESPKGMYFFKLTGPDPTVKAARAAFDAMLDTLTP